VENRENPAPPVAPVPPRAPFSGLASRIILFVFASTFATATLVSWISIQSTHASLRGAIDRLYPLALDHVTRRLDTWATSLRSELDHASHARSDDALAWTLGNSKLLVGVADFDADGSLRAARGDVPVELARRALDAEAGVATAHRDDGEPPWIALAVRHEPGGGVVGVVPAARLVPLLAAELPSESALVAITDDTGRVLVSAGVPPGVADVPRLDPAGFEAGGSLREYDLGGTHVIGTGRPLDLLGWHLAVVTPFDAAYGPVLSVVTRVFIADLCIILFFSFLAYRVTARVVRPIEDLSEAARRVAQGDTDLVIQESHARDEIGLLTRTFNDMMRQLRRHREQIETTNRDLTDRNARLQQANEVLNQLSITDGLTKLHNHRFFQDHLTREIKRVSRSRDPLSMLLIDIDDFKRLNDRLGHAAGDEILMRIAQILNGAVRETDLCARYGGEEFIILATNTDILGAYRLAEKVRTAIAESSFIVDDSLRPLRVTVSIGVARFDGNRKQFFQKADQALYRAKANGKNCVVVHEDDADD